MEIPENRPAEYKSDSPAKAATKSFVWSFITDMALFSMVGLVFDRVLSKIPFGKDTWGRVRDDALINGILAAGFGIWRANTAYNDTKAAEKFRIQVACQQQAQSVPLAEPAPDTATELAHTQQPLTSASHALEVATNQAAGLERTPASHAEKLAAPVESHVEQAVIDKAAAERTTATIH